MPSRRLEDRIRELCSQLKNSCNQEEMVLVAGQLRAALREHAARLQLLAELQLVENRSVGQRRKSPVE